MSQDIWESLSDWLSDGGWQISGSVRTFGLSCQDVISVKMLGRNPPSRSKRLHDLNLETAEN